MRRSTIQMLAFSIIIMLIALIPMFVLASEINEDEWEKAGSGVALATIALLGVIIREVWKYIWRIDPELKHRLEESGQKRPDSYFILDTVTKKDNNR